METTENDSVAVLFNINNKTVKVKVKTKDARKQLRVGEFKHFVQQKLKSNFTDEFDNYVWKVYDQKLKKYLWANDNVIINDNDKVQASVKEIMTMTVIKPNISRNGSDESVQKYEVEIKDKRATKTPKKTSIPPPINKEINGVSSSKVSDVKAKTSPKNESINVASTPKTSISPSIKKDMNGVSSSKVMDIKRKTSPKNDSNNVASTPKTVDIKPILMKLVKRYNEEFKWIAEKSGESNFENDDYDGVWNLIAADLNEKAKSPDHVYEYDEVKEQFGLLMSLYVSILSATTATNVESWQFFNMFHEMDLTPFIKNIGELRNKFEGINDDVTM